MKNETGKKIREYGNFKIFGKSLPDCKAEKICINEHTGRYTRRSTRMRILGNVLAAVLILTGLPVCGNISGEENEAAAAETTAAATEKTDEVKTGRSSNGKSTGDFKAYSGDLDNIDNISVIEKTYNINTGYVNRRYVAEDGESYGTVKEAAGADDADGGSSVISGEDQTIGSDKDTAADSYAAPKEVKIKKVKITEKKDSEKKDSGKTDSEKTDRSSGKAGEASGRNSIPVLKTVSAAGENSLPSSYSAVDAGLITAVKDQGVTGSCWSFASMKSAEANLIKKGLSTADTADLSESHLVWYTYETDGDTSSPTYGDGAGVSVSSSSGSRDANSYFDFFTGSDGTDKNITGSDGTDSTVKGTDKTDPNSSYSNFTEAASAEKEGTSGIKTKAVKTAGSSDDEEDDAEKYMAGGSAAFASYVLAAWTGAASETEYPFNALTNSDLLKMVSSMSSKTAADKKASSAHLQNSLNYDSASRDDIKKAIVENGALTIAVYFDYDEDSETRGYLTRSSDGSYAYYQTKYTDTNEAVDAANHALTIVGWDDDYSASNFIRSEDSKRRGYGLEPAEDGAWLIANSYGESFRDKGYFWLSYDDASICDINSMDMESSDNYDNIYQYDGFGYGDMIEYSNTSDPIKAGNIFTSEKAEDLKAVSFYTAYDDEDVIVSVYSGVSGDTPDSGTLEETVSEHEDFSGYHTIELKNDIELAADERYSVVVSYQPDSSNITIVPIEGDDISTESDDDTISLNYGSSSGQSFININDKWYDGSSSVFTSTLTDKKASVNNVCIKAFTDDAGSESADRTAPEGSTKEEYEKSRNSSGSGSSSGNENSSSSENGNGSGNGNDSSNSGSTDNGNGNTSGNDGGSESSDISGKDDISQDAQNSVNVQTPAPGVQPGGQTPPAAQTPVPSGSSGQNTASGSTQAAQNTSSSTAGGSSRISTSSSVSSGRDNDQADFKAAFKKGKEFTRNGYRYRIVRVRSMHAEYPADVRIIKAPAAASVKVKNFITYKGAACRVVSVGKNAFSKGKKKIKNITLGNNITEIQGHPFRALYKLKNVKINSRKLKTVSASAFNVKRKVIFRVPASRFSKYRKLIFKHGGTVKKNIVKTI